MSSKVSSIWAHALVKNESRWLWYAVTSVVDHVDKVLLWNSGSTDETKKIIDALAQKYPAKIEKKYVQIDSKYDFATARQKMLDATTSDWFLVLDGDEIWWEESIKKVVETINNDSTVESIVVPTINLVGDIFHYQEKAAGKYKFGNRTGHYNLRAVKRDIPGLHSKGEHGIWGWVDGEDKMIQDRHTFKIIEAPYLHATNVVRSQADSLVIKRSKKLKYEIGISFPRDFYYPESFFKERPSFIQSPWETTKIPYKLRALFETPLRKLKRRIIKGGVGY